MTDRSDAKNVSIALREREVLCTRPAVHSWIAALRVPAALAIGLTLTLLTACKVSGPFNFTVPPDKSIHISPSTLPHATVGVAYSQQLTATGGTAPYFWQEGGNVNYPAGLTLDSDSTGVGLLHGTPTAPPSAFYSITVRGLR